MDESVRNDSSRETGVSARVTDATVTRAAHHRRLMLPVGLVDIAAERVTVEDVKCRNTLLLLV
jgi:hypothetical protein